MKKGTIFLILVSLLLAVTSFSQVLKPVTWSFDSKKLTETEAELILTAKINEGWHVYATDIPEHGPIPTSFKFEPSDAYELSGKIISPKPIDKYDNAFEMDLRYFEGNVDFKQKIKIKSTSAFEVKGELEFMACDDKRCLPPEYVDYTFDINGTQQGSKTETTPQVKGVPKPADEQAEAILEQNKPQVVINIDTTPLQKTDKEVIQTEKSEEIEAGGSLWTFFFIALGVGFIGLLTPCVYPMIPMTISFFMNASQNKMKSKTQAVFFGLSIIFIYTVVGVLVSAIFGADTIKQVSEHWITNILFFLLFAVFAASFFGMFEIILPSWLTSKSDKQADKGGYIGAFFMALTLVLVSFSCTVPFVGGILVEAATGQVIKPIVGMFGFSLAFGIVFTILAIFPSWLGKMPRSGGWLNSVKVVLAFIILAIGMKYLLVPNQALGWGITREVYIAVWMILFTLMGFYLLGKIKFSHDSPVDHISVPRLVLVIISFTFVLYLLPGLFGAPLKAVSGYLPSNSAWDLDEIIRESTQNINTFGSIEKKAMTMCDVPKYNDLFDLPYGLQGYFDYDQGMACARKLNKPVFLDIKGHACTNCKVIEKNIWAAPEVLKRLSNDYVIIALYVDDNFELPENEWIISTFDGKLKKTIGRKNTDFQITRFDVNAQPYYVLLDLDGKELTEPIAFEQNVEKYVAFLDKGIQEFKKRHP